MMKEIKLYKSPLKSLKLFIISSIFVFLGIWLIDTENESSFWLWFCLCFFGLGFIIGLFNIIDRRPQIIINKIGILDRSTRQGIINWEFINEAYDLNIYNQNFISIVTDEKFILKKKPYSWANKLNKDVGAQKVNLNVGQLKVDIEKLVTLINILKNEPIENRETVIEMYEDRVK